MFCRGVNGGGNGKEIRRPHFCRRHQLLCRHATPAPPHHTVNTNTRNRHLTDRHPRSDTNTHRTVSQRHEHPSHCFVQPRPTPSVTHIVITSRNHPHTICNDFPHIHQDFLPGTRLGHTFHQFDESCRSLRKKGFQRLENHV